MEPNNLDSSQIANNEDARLAAWLRQTQRSLPDDGFSDGVLAALPVRKSTVHVPLRALVCIPAGCLGALLAWWQLSANGGLDTARDRLEATLGQVNEALAASTSPLALPVLLLSALVTGLSVAFALRGHLRFR